MSLFKDYFCSILSKKKTEKLPYKIPHRRVYLLPTKHGVTFAGLLLIMLTVSLRNNNNLGILLTLLLASVFFISLIYTHANLIGVTVKSLKFPSVFAGDEICGHISLFSTTLLRPLLRVSIPEGDQALFELEEEKIQSVSFSRKGSTRGKYKPNTIILETEFPFSFFRAWTQIHTDQHFIIYPKPIANSNFSFMSYEAGMNSSQSTTQGAEDFAELKEYQAGDSPRKIYWKGFSRGSGLHTKVFEATQGNIMVLDFHEFSEADIERKLSMLSYLVIEASRNNYKFLLKLPNQQIGPDKGEAHKTKCLSALALFDQGVADVRK